MSGPKRMRRHPDPRLVILGVRITNNSGPAMTKNLIEAEIVIDLRDRDEILKVVRSHSLSLLLMTHHVTQSEHAVEVRAHMVIMHLEPGEQLQNNRLEG